MHHRAHRVLQPVLRHWCAPTVALVCAGNALAAAVAVQALLSHLETVSFTDNVNLFNTFKYNLSHSILLSENQQVFHRLVSAGIGAGW